GSSQRRGIRNPHGGIGAILFRRKLAAVLPGTTSVIPAQVGTVGGSGVVRRGYRSASATRLMRGLVPPWQPTQLCAKTAVMAAKLGGRQVSDVASQARPAQHRKPLMGAQVPPACSHSPSKSTDTSARPLRSMTRVTLATTPGVTSTVTGSAMKL